MARSSVPTGEVGMYRGRRMREVRKGGIVSRVARFTSRSAYVTNYHKLKHHVPPHIHLSLFTLAVANFAVDLIADRTL